MTSEKPTLWKRFSTRLSRGKSKEPEYNNSGNYGRDPYGSPSSSRSNRPKLTARGRAQLKRMRERVKEKFDNAKTTVRSKSAGITRRRKAKSTSEYQSRHVSADSDASDQSNKKKWNQKITGSFKGLSRSISKLKPPTPKLNKAKSRSSPKQNRKSSVSRKNYIVAGENDSFTRSPNKSTDSYYPYGDVSSPPGTSGSSANASNVWISSTDSSNGQTTYKNVVTGTKTYSRPHGSSIIILDSKTIESSVELRHRLAQRSQSFGMIGSSNSGGSPSSPRIRRETQKIKKDPELEKFMKEVGLDHRLPEMYSEGIDYSTLSDLTEQSLTEIGLNIGERIKLMKAIEARFPAQKSISNTSSSSARILGNPGGVSLEEFSPSDDDDEEELFYSMQRGRSRSVPRVVGRNGIETDLEDYPGLENTPAATIQALTAFVDKLLSKRETNGSSDSTTQISVADKADAEPLEMTVEEDRKHQQRIRKDELERQRRLQIIAREKHGMEARRRGEQTQSEPLKFELAMNFELAEEEEKIDFDLDTASEPRFSLDGGTPEIGDSKLDFDFLLAEDKVDFGFLTEAEDEVAEFGIEDGTFMEVNDMAADNDFDLERKVFDLEQEIITAEMLLASNSQVSPATSPTLLDEAAEEEHFDSKNNSTVIEVEETISTEFASDEEAREEVHSSPPKAEPTEISSGRDTRVEEDIEQPEIRKEQEVTKTTVFLHNLSKRVTDSGFGKIVSNEAKRRNVDLKSPISQEQIEFFSATRSNLTSSSGSCLNGMMEEMLSRVELFILLNQSQAKDIC